MVDKNKALKEYIEEKYCVVIKRLEFEVDYYLVTKPIINASGRAVYKLLINNMFTRLCDILDYLEGKITADSFGGISNKSVAKKSKNEDTLLNDICSYWSEVAEDIQRRADYLAHCFEARGFSSEEE